jgi:hypothetical protein
MIRRELAAWQTRHILRRNPMVRIVAQTHPRRELATEGALTLLRRCKAPRSWLVPHPVSVRSSQSLHALTISQVEVFEDELAVATGHWRAARATCNIAFARLGSAFTLDDLIKGFAVRTGEEGIERRRTASSHDSPQRHSTFVISYHSHAGECNVTRLTRSTSILPATRFVPMTWKPFQGPTRQGAFLFLPSS